MITKDNKDLKDEKTTPKGQVPKATAKKPLAPKNDEETKKEIPQEQADETTPKVEKPKDSEANKIFANYKECEILYKTSDGYYFIEKSDAVNHARTLKEQGLEEIKHK